MTTSLLLLLVTPTLPNQIKSIRGAWTVIAPSLPSSWVTDRPLLPEFKKICGGSTYGSIGTLFNQKEERRIWG